MQIKKLRFLIMILAVLFIGVGSAKSQTSRSVEDILQQRSAKQSTKKTKKKGIFKKKNKSPFTTDAQLKADFEQRMKDNQKKYKKEGRMSAKPQYSNPLYFGHKRPPKKRPVGKRKMCKECGIVH